MADERRGRAAELFRAWIVPSSLLFMAFALAYGIATAFDYFVIGYTPAAGAPMRGFLDVLVHPEAEGAKDVLSTIGQAVPGILGLAITVVAIIVELASNRYTSQVTDLFIRDRVNLCVFGLFVISSIFPLWVSASYGGGYVPRFGFLVTLILASLSILLLIPYFSYVFTFLAPANIIDTIRRQVRGAILAESRQNDAPADAREKRRMLELKLAVSNSVEQIADIALNSILQRDRSLGMDAVAAARGVVFDYFDQKPKMPPAWFEIGPEERVGNPDYVTLSDEGLEDMRVERVWVEHKVMKQLHLVFVQALNNLRDLNNLIAMFLKDVAIEALKREDKAAHRLALKFFNTCMRSAFAAKDVRTAYNILYQYREVAEALIEQKRLSLVELVFGYFKYYGQLFDSGGLGFILETVAHDLDKLVRLAMENQLSNLDALLGIFLEVDRAPDVNSSDVHLRGVRKAQVALAAYCVSKGRRDLAERIGNDMRGEPHERLRSIREELHAAERAFWEITDRGVNFDYLEPELRPHLDDYYDNILKVGRQPTRQIPAGKLEEKP